MWKSISILVEVIHICQPRTTLASCRRLPASRSRGARIQGAAPYCLIMGIVIKCLLCQREPISLKNFPVCATTAFGSVCKHTMAAMCSSVVEQPAGQSSRYNMIPKINRLTRAQVRSVLSHGSKKYTDSSCIVIVEKSPDTTSRLSAIVGKQISRSAVVRNGLRRRIYQGIGNAWEFIPSNMHGIIMARQGMLKKTPQEIILYIARITQKYIVRA